MRESGWGSLAPLGAASQRFTFAPAQSTPGRSWDFRQARRLLRIVGRPTPTGTHWPFLPQVPMPGSSAMSLPMARICVSASAPSPIRVAPLTGAPTLAVLDQVGLGAGEDELAVGDVDLAAAEADGVDAVA